MLASCIWFRPATDTQTWLHQTWLGSSLASTGGHQIEIIELLTVIISDLLAHCAVDQVDPVEEIHNVNRQPIIEVLSFGKFDDLPQIDPRVEAGLGLFVKGILHCARLELLFGSKCFLFVKNFTEFSEVHDAD